MQDLFEILGLRRTASDREIKEAYRRLAKMYHPDSNPSTPEAHQQMQAINQAKAVLFDPVKREEHRAKLGLREKLTAQRLEEIRNAERFQPRSEGTQKRVQVPTSKWERSGRKMAIGAVSLMLIVTIIVMVGEMTAHPPSQGDPVAAIIARYHQLDGRPMDTLSDVRPTKQQMDTMSIAAEDPESQRLHGDLYYKQLEFALASKYFEVYLLDHQDDAMAMRLSHAYFMRHRYAEAMEVLRDNVPQDSNRVKAFYAVGESFIHAEKPFDARDAFAAAVKVAEKMKREGHAPPQEARRAQNELPKLE